LLEIRISGAGTNGDMVLGITSEIVESWLGYKAGTKEKDFSAANIVR